MKDQSSEAGKDLATATGKESTEADAVAGLDSISEAWWSEVVRICKERGYADWFFADREAWLECSDDMTPEDAVNYQLECAL